MPFFLKRFFVWVGLGRWRQLAFVYGDSVIVSPSLYLKMVESGATNILEAEGYRVLRDSMIPQRQFAWRWSK